MKEVLQFKQSTSSVIFYFTRKNGKNFGSSERLIISDIIFSVVKSKSYFESIIFCNEGKYPDVDYVSCLVILGAVNIFEKETIGKILSQDERNFLENVKIKSIKEISIEFLHSKQLNEKLSVPSWIFDNWTKQIGLKRTITFIESNHKKFSTYFRVNLLRREVSSVKRVIEDSGNDAEQLKLLPGCLKFAHDSNFTQIKSLFQQGDIEIQDLGSQIISKLAAPKRNTLIVDFCAGTGGKTLAMGSELKNSGKIYSIDIDRGRIKKLKKRLIGTGIENVWPMVISSLNDVKLIKLNNKIDTVLVDVPCSGFGTLRRNPDLKWRFSYNMLTVMNKLQHDILERASLLCKVGGFLVYATCSSLYEENQQIVSDFLVKNNHFMRTDNKLTLEKQNVILDEEWKVYDFFGNIQLWTDLTDTDTFFMTRLVRIR